MLSTLNGALTMWYGIHKCYTTSHFCFVSLIKRQLAKSYTT